MKKITFICTCLFIFTLLCSEKVLSVKPIVSYHVQKINGGWTALFNRYDYVDSDVWSDNEGKHVDIFCENPGSSRCERYGSIVYNNPYTGDQLDDEICDMINDDCNEMIEYSEQQFVEDEINEGSSSKTTAVTENNVILYYIVVTCYWEYEYIDEEEEHFNGNVQITASMLLPDEL